MISRFLLAAGLAMLMVVSGIGTYVFLGSRPTNLSAVPQAPPTTPSPGAFNLPGTLFLAQSGALYSLSAGRFRQLTTADGWSEPAIYTAGNLLAVRRSTRYSDVYVLSRFGKVLRKLTNNNQAPPGNFDTRLLHWSFYPRLSHNQKTLFMSYDMPKGGFDVPMSIWAVPVGKTISQGRIWTNSIDYTGGDMEPLPLPSGALIYTKFLYFDQHIVSQIWITNQPEMRYSCGTFCITVPPGPGRGRPLTRPEEDCAQPSLSPDGRTMAMICTHETQVSYLVMASFNSRTGTLGTPRNVITKQLVAQPTWAPDGSGIAYLAPALVGAGFQLWWLPGAAYVPATPSPIPSASATPTTAPAPIPAKPVEITTNLGFDATSPIAWIP